MNSDDEDCNLDDDEEEKTMGQSSAQKKAFISVNNILDRIKKDELNVTNLSQLTMKLNDTELQEEDQFGSLAKSEVQISKIIARRMDNLLLRDLALKCRGFLYRRSSKYPDKWQKCFYHFGMEEFTSIKCQKILYANGLKEMIFKEEITNMRHLKRIRLS